MNVTVRYFAALREAVGRETEHLQTQAADIGALRAELRARGDRWAEVFAPGRAVKAALDQVLAGDQVPLHEGAEVAFFPPVTGG